MCLVTPSPMEYSFLHSQVTFGPMRYVKASTFAPIEILQNTQALLYKEKTKQLHATRKEQETKVPQIH